MRDLKLHLTDLCEDYGLSYNTQHAPIKIGPDIYMFAAVDLNIICRKHGQCKQERYYALTGGERVDILNKNMTTLKRKV